VYYTTSGIITLIGDRPVHRLREDWMESSLTFLMTILRHKIVASNGLSHFLNVAQNLLSARYSNVQYHSQLLQNAFY